MAAGQSDNILDYTSLDFASCLNDLRRFAIARLGRDLTSLPPSDPFAVLLEVLAYCTDLLSYTENQHVREGVPTRAFRVTNFRDVARAFAFEFRERTGSEATITATLDPGVLALGNITLSKLHKVGTPGGVVFHPKQEYVFASAGPTTVTFEVEQGDRVTDEMLSASSPGTADQTYILTYGPVIPDSVLIQVGGVEWTRVRTINLSESTGTEYELSFDENDVCTVRFGDGAHGRIPPATQEILGSYRAGGGQATNVALGTITERTDLPDGVLSVTNAAAASGGFDRESLATAKARLPVATRANDRGVSAPDYAAIALQTGGIVKAYSESGVCGLGGCGRAIVVYAIAEGGSSGSGLTNSQKTAILLNVREKGVGGKRVLVRDPSYARIRVAMDVHVESSALTSRVEADVNAVLVDMLDSTTLDFGLTLSLQDVYRDVAPNVVAGLRRIQITEFCSLPYLGAYLSAPATGNGTLENAEVTSTSTRREWKFSCVSSSGGRAVFDVVERVVFDVGEVTDSSVKDEEQNFPANFFVGTWQLRYQPYDPAETGVRTITGSTSNTVSVSGSSLQDYTEPGDVAVVEKVAPVTRYSYENEWVVPGGGYGSGTSLPAPGALFVVGMDVRVESSDGAVTFTSITGGTTGAWTVADTLPAAAAGVTLIVRVMTDLDGSSFALVAGSRDWVPGDEFFVDTYPLLDDLRIRSSVFPELTSENLTLRMVGGRSV